MKATTTKTLRALAASLLMSATLLGGVACSPQQGSDTSSQTSAVAPTTEQYDEVLSAPNVTSTLISEKFYDKKVTNDDEALAAVKSAYDRIGADETTEFEIMDIVETETGETYYVFDQKAGDVLVYGASVKLITNKDGEVIGLVSSILPKVTIAKAEDWEITAEQAEQTVLQQLKEEGVSDAKVVKDATEQTIIPVPDYQERYQYAWVVYTPNYDKSSEMSYLAHYVDAQNGYLYAVPIAEPHNADAASGDKANFEFDKFEQNTWTGTVTLHDGTTKEIKVPVLIDPSDNAQILGDGKRKILCADYAEWAHKDTLAPRVSDDATFDNTELLAYDTFIKVWDFYESIGWPGPDGEKTPTLLLMDYVNANGEPEDVAHYSGRANGFQTFAFNRLNPDGENMDVIAHEFTHCVTGTTMTTNLYFNDMGAINEGMSDIMGNLVEMILVEKPETAWLIGDSSGVATLRSMKEPHEFNQPEFRWDTYYAPSVKVGTGLNDQGGAHVNSSMLNLVSYKLDQAGMKPEDQVYFWMNVALSMTPYTDYVQMAQLLPWCLERTGYAQYVDALNKAIEEGAYSTTATPETPSAGNGKVTITYDAPDIVDAGLVRFEITPKDSDIPILTWPAAGSNEAVCFVPAGDYWLAAGIGSENGDEVTTYIYTDAGWQIVEALSADAPPSNAVVTQVQDGKTIDIPSKGLPTK